MNTSWSEANGQPGVAYRPPRGVAAGGKYAAAGLAVSLGTLLAPFAFEASPPVLAPFLLIAQATVLLLVGLAYVEDGRVQATPALVLFAIMALYTVPVTVSFALLDFPAFAALARSALVMTAALTGMGVVLILFDQRGPASPIADLIERHQRTLRAGSYALLAIGTVWLVLLFPSPSSLYSYLFATTYLEKHNFFEGRGLLAEFLMCYELAGLLAALTLAIPSARRTCSASWICCTGADDADLDQSGLSVVDRAGVLPYFAARSFWPRNGFRIWVLTAYLAVLTPSFLIWAHLRNFISTDGIFATEEWRDHISRE